MYLKIKDKIPLINKMSTFKRILNYGPKISLQRSLVLSELAFFQDLQIILNLEGEKEIYRKEITNIFRA